MNTLRSLWRWWVDLLPEPHPFDAPIRVIEADGLQYVELAPEVPRSEMIDELLKRGGI